MIKSISAAAAFLFLGGCGNLAYYAQAIAGHAEVMAAAHPIRELIADPATDEKMRRRLERVSAIRDFASRNLALPDNGSYRSYADLSRPYVVWNVFATPELSVEPRQWCLVLVGCVSYRGYYDERAAHRYAEELEQQGLDTHVGGVTAYSTLGHFDDPVLETFLRLGERESARIIFHELSHQVVYVQGDTAFNESFAVTVEEEGLRRWLEWNADSGLLREFETQQLRKAQFYRLVAACRERLRTLYSSPLSREEMRRAKNEAYADLRRAYAELKTTGDGYAAYDRWFAQPLNNAVLASVAIYTQWVPAFRSLLAQEHGDLPSYYKRVAALADLPEKERWVALDRLAAREISDSRAITAEILQIGVIESMPAGEPVAR
jgi:predicted aminopeptidase